MANEIKKIDAYRSLKPDVDTYGYENNPTWPEGAGTPPTDSEINTEVTRLQAAYDAKKYQRDRAKEYPSWEFQLDYIYHNGVAKWKTDVVDPVKSKYPKP